MRMSSWSRADRAVATVAAVVAVVIGAGIILRLSGVDLVAPLGGGQRIVVDRAQVWRLFSSGLIVRGAVPFVQLAVLIAVAVEVMRRQGPVLWAVAAVGGHVLSAVVAYWVMQVEIWKRDGGAYVAAGWHDYGISCLLAGSLGALCADAVLRWRATRSRREGALAAFLGLLAIGTAPLALSWYGVEHGLSFATGAVVIALVGRRSGRGTAPAGG
jgi:hypothetical protein